MINVKIIKKPKNSSRSDSGSFGSAVVGKETNNILSTLQSLSVFSEGLARLLIPCDDADKELSWEQAFETDAAGEIKAKSLKATVDLWSVGGISALGKSDTKPEGGISYGRLDAWSDYDSTKAGYVLSAALGYGLKSRLDALPSALHNLIVKKNGTTIGTYKPDAATVIDITDVASAADLLAHTANNALHITAAERTRWNNKVDRINGKGLSTNDFTTELLNKLNGIEAGAHNYIHPTATATVIAAGNGKVLSAITVNNLGHITSVSAKTLSPADIPSLDWSQITSGRPTTLAGYGITDAKISGGTITLGQGSITPLTAHQPIYNLTFSAGPFSAITYNPKSMAQVVNIPVSTNHITEGDNLYFTNQRAVAALKPITDNIINSIASVNTLANTLSQMFIPYAGDTELTWAAVSAGATYDSLKANGGVWTESFISVLGKSAGGGSFGLMKVWPATDPGSGTTDALGSNLGWELRQDVLSLKSGSALSVVTAGSGNAITDIVKSGTTVTATKGATFITQHQPLDYLNVKDVRGAVRPPTYFDAFRMSAWFNQTGMPTSNWYSGINMQGWSGDYASWQLAANSTNNTNVKDLYFRVGINATWEAWQKVLTDANYSSTLGSVYAPLSHSHSQYALASALGNYVTLDTPQTISGSKGFKYIIVYEYLFFCRTNTDKGIYFAPRTDGGLDISTHSNYAWEATIGTINSSGALTMKSFVKSGGTASQFLMADGSVKALTDITSAYVTALGTSGNYLTWTKNGVVNNVVVPWANNSDKLNGVAVQRFVYGDNNTATTDLVGAITDTIRKSGFYRANNDTTCPLVIHSSHSTNTYAFQLGTSYYDTSNLYFRHLSNNVWEAWRMVLDTKNYTGTLDTRYVKKSGDTMTGALTVPRLNINATGSDAHFTAGNANNLYASVGGKVLGIWNASEMSYRASTDYNGQVYLGSALARWANVYATTINVSSTALVANLNADMLDGKHATDFLLRSGGSMTNTNLVSNLNADMLDGRHVGVAPGRVASFYDFPIYSSFGYEGVADETYFSYLLKKLATDNSGEIMTIGRAHPNSQGVFIMHGYPGRKNGYPEYGSGLYVSITGCVAPIRVNNGIYTYGNGMFEGNSASATKLATARTINGTNFDGTANIVTSYWGATRTLWGQSCNGSGNVSGDMTGVGTIRATGGTYRFLANYNTSPYGLRIWTSSNGDVSFQAEREANIAEVFRLLLNPNGGNVGIGTTSPAYKLDVSGQIRANVATGTAPFVTPSTTLCANLNADLLDGLHLSDIRSVGYAMQDTIIDASSLNVNTWYPVVINIGSRNNTRIEVIVALDSGTKPSWSTHEYSGFSVRVIWEVNGSGWGTNPVNRTIYASDYAFAEVSPVRGLGQLSNSSNEYVFVRGGGKYRFRTSNGATNISLKTSTFTVNNQSVSPTTTAPAEIIRDNARITDNVASATKLQTARTIWGQTFNGTANVSGALTRVTDIIASGDIKAKRLSLNNGASYIEWDAANNAYKVNGNFYATGGSSCLGFNYLSATDIGGVNTLKANVLYCDTLNFGLSEQYGLWWNSGMESVHVLAPSHIFLETGYSTGSIIFLSKADFGGNLGWAIDTNGNADLNTVKASTSMTINNAVFTVSGNEIYVTIGSTRYKLTKTTA